MSARRETRESAGYRISFSRFSSLAQAAPYRVSYFFLPPNVDLVVQTPLDSSTGSSPITVLEGVRGVAMRFLSEDDRWSETWPPSGSAATALPRAVELTLDLEGLGPVTRLVARP